MTVTREDVFYAYRLILGREPESEAVVAEHMKYANGLEGLRQVFLQSPEFVSRFDRARGVAPPVGRFMDASEVDIDLRCSPEQMQRMFDGIARAWQAFGQTEPHWSVLTDDQFKPATIAENLDDFYATGIAEIDLRFNGLKRNGLPVTFEKALDFGCGVGRLSLALARYARAVTCVDISPPHIALAGERAQRKGIDNVSFKAITSVPDLEQFSGYDFIISLIVLQHNPPPIMAAIYEKLLAALAPGGVALVQFPTYIHGQRFSVEDYLANAQPQMEMNSLSQAAIFAIVEGANCRVVEVREDDAAGYNLALSHSFLVQKR